jgi:hypothetical protein
VGGKHKMISGVHKGYAVVKFKKDFRKGPLTFPSTQLDTLSPVSYQLNCLNSLIQILKLFLVELQPPPLYYFSDRRIFIDETYKQETEKSLQQETLWIYHL